MPGDVMACRKAKDRCAMTQRRFSGRRGVVQREHDREPRWPFDDLSSSNSGKRLRNILRDDLLME